MHKLEAIVIASQVVSDILRGNPLEDHLQTMDFSSYRDMFSGMNSQELVDLSIEAAERWKYLESIKPSYAAAIYFGIEVISRITIGNEYDNEVIYSGQVQFTLEDGLTWKAKGMHKEEYGQSWIDFTLVDTRQPGTRKPIAF